ncbi:hypothetical protein B0H11DRAFT_1907550 [Mycena galericulata]|nr:hypothetical protein B0H11DRAFT_1907550 [Mycena galericulata]
MYHQSQRGQSYTFTTQEEWRASMDSSLMDTSSSPTAAGSVGNTGDTGADFLTQLDVDQLAPAHFADIVCNTLQLNVKFRSDLHTFVKLVDALTRAQAIPMIYSMATNFYTQQIILDASPNYAAIIEALNEVKMVLAQNLDLTKEQKAEVTAACKAKVGDPKRTDFDNDAIRADVTAYLKKHQNSNGFKALFEVKGQARTKALNQFIGLQASYAKSHFRTHIKESLGTCVTLATIGAMRKLVGSTENISPVHVMRMVILRDFARDNKELLRKEPGTVDEQQGSNKRARVGDSEPIRKVPRGTDNDCWWPSFSAFIDAKNKDYSTDLKSPGWSQHIGRLVVHERKLFPNDLIPLIPINEAAMASSGSNHPGGERVMRALPTRSPAVNSVDGGTSAPATGSLSSSVQLPPLHFPASSSSVNGLTLPGIGSSVERQAGALLSGSIANQQHQLYDSSYTGHGSMPTTTPF